MTPELKAKWIAALRSGDYKQCKHMLRHDETYCCLGVLGEISGLLTTQQVIYNKGYDTLDRIMLSEDRVECANMNDRGKTFTEIADWIEENIDTVVTRNETTKLVCQTAAKVK